MNLRRSCRTGVFHSLPITVGDTLTLNAGKPATGYLYDELIHLAS